MRHLKTLNQKAARIEEYVKEQQAAASQDDDVVALQRGGGGVPQAAPHFPAGCAVIFSPGLRLLMSASCSVSISRSPYPSPCYLEI